MARKPIPLPVPFEEPEAPDCPRCPKKGAPAWMATFADIATLLMAFFVLILSFADFNVPKFKMVAGSLERAFGVQREINVVEQPKGTTILELNFSPAPEISLTERMTQDTTDTVQPELKQPTADDFNADPAETAKADALNSLIDALHDGALAVELAENPAAALSDQLQMLADGLDALATASDDPLIAGLADQLDQMAAAAQTQQDASSDQIAEGMAQRSAALAEAELRVALRQEVSQGLVTVENREDRVIVTVGAGGAFPSGTADLTPQAQDVMARLALTAMNDASTIVVTGHTDTVPLAPGSPFSDNWGLAAARASAVVRELAGTQLIEPDRLSAISRGENAPISDNTTAQGRADNRRIEIEIIY